MNPKWKQHVFALNALLFGLLALFCLMVSWDGLLAWWHLTSRPYEEVRDSPLGEIWSSRWVMPALLFAFAGGLNAAYWLHLRRRKR